ncbi:superoxide dismutase [Hyphococcus sp.]|uniref:superoxide dismutase n=1 Tax=Hyphococcus sp. TaxID=2038636 RepID=UPI003CCBD939
MAITLPELPYDKGALAPHISKETLQFHYDKHHSGYVDKTNAAVKGTDLDDASVEDIISAAKEKSDQGLFNNAAQVWNHTFYWDSMSPDGGGEPTGDIAAAIKDSFGGYDNFKDAFAAKGAGQFGSGWAWLVVKDGKLDVTNTPNAETPLTDSGVTPLITMDVWEHAYYLDYQNKRPDYISAFIDNLVNWDFANKNLKSA